MVAQLPLNPNNEHRERVKEGTRKKGSPAYLWTRDHLGDEMVLIGSLYKDHLLTCQLSFAYISILLYAAYGYDPTHQIESPFLEP